MELIFTSDPETTKALKKMAEEGDPTIYGVIGGELIPIATLEKHPDCSQELFDAFLKAIALYKMEGQR